MGTSVVFATDEGSKLPSISDWFEEKNVSDTQTQITYPSGYSIQYRHKSGGVYY